MKVFAADPGTNFGWAYWDGQLTSGTWDLHVLRDESAGFRLIRLRNKLRTVGAVDRVFLEEAGHTRFSRAAQVAGQLEGVLIPWALDCEAEYKSVNPKELKKWATGKGNAGKPLMVAAAQRITAYDGVDSDEADARLVLLFGVLRFGTREQVEKLLGHLQVIGGNVVLLYQRYLGEQSHEQV